MGGKKNRNKNAGKVAGIIIGLFAAGVIGYLLHTFTAPGNNNTTVHVTVDDDFGLSFDGGVVNKTYNLTSFGVYSYTMSRNMFNAINAFFNANTTKFLDMNNITAETGIPYVVLGFTDYFYSADADYFYTADENTCVEGKTGHFTFGDNALLFWEVWIEVWYNGTTHYESFSAPEIVALDDCLYHGNLSRAVWLDALPFIFRSVNSLTIADWQQMSLVDDQLIVDIGGTPDTLYEYGFGP
nr:hypothetical protein [Candidatus Sigynarchaeota archaeon]